MIIPDEEVTTREVKSWTGIHLLHFQSSSCSQKVRVLLREKGLSWTSHPINLGTDAHVTPFFLGINPRGVVPVLVLDGVVHVESNDIMEVLDGLPSDAEPFFPIDQRERERVKADLAREDALHMDLRSLTMGFMMPRRLVTKSEETLARWEREGRGDPKRAREVAWWRDYASNGAANGISHEQAQASVDAHREVFEELDTRLAASRWLLGERLSVLDLSWFITTRRLRNVGYPLERHQRLALWHERLEMRPAFEEETRDPFPLRVVRAAYRVYRRLDRSRLCDVTN